MINWKDVMVAQQMREDALNRAEKDRLARQMQRDWARGRLSFPRERYQLWMARLGDLLVSWGQHLKEHHTAPGAVVQSSGSVVQ